MKLYIAHALTPSGQRINAGIWSEADEQTTRDVFEAALQQEEPGAVIVGFHEAEADHDHDHGEDSAPVMKREPYAIENMVMMGWSLVTIILFVIRFLQRRSR